MLPTSRSSEWFAEGNTLKLGLFALNGNGALSPTRVPESWPSGWELNLELARRAEAAGLDFLLPFARWRGYRGESRFHSETLESLTWATGLLAHTQRIKVFGTVHAQLVHPLFAAKQLVVADHIGQGRLGLNIVCGWNKDEFEMFGLPQLEHDERYAYAQEWWDIVRRAWTEEEPFDFEGRYFQMKGVIGRPRPYEGRTPIVMNAGTSPAGLGFATRNCDMLFCLPPDVESARKEVSRLKSAAKEVGRNADVLLSAHVVCRPTRKEAEEYYRYYSVEMADWEAVEHMASMMFPQGAVPPEVMPAIKALMAGGHGTMPIIGGPEEVARRLIDLREAGIAGVALSFVNFLDELPFFCAEVLPRLRQAGVRS
jgi:alkanesulfonate monooxygenase SsuD/methylene tetrahydromethanopterin reductase-like flavin-dependent oxidoreductase (luciferase family)